MTLARAGTCHCAEQRDRRGGGDLISRASRDIVEGKDLECTHSPGVDKGEGDVVLGCR